MITFHLRIRPEAKRAFVDWQSMVNAQIVGFPGFVSLEFLSSDNKDNHWTVVQRFSDKESASAWRNSPQSKELIEELQHYVVENGFREIVGGEADLQGGVTEIIVTEVNPQEEKAYREWSSKIHQVEAQFPGFRGVYVQSPNQSSGKNWITLLQFDTPENLDRWLNSPERKEFLDNSGSLITSVETHRVVSPYAGWFASLAKAGEVPALWKQTMIILLVLFPIVMIELKYLNPPLAAMNSSLRTFIGNAISVTLISFPMMPIAIWFLSWWLVPGKHKVMQKTIIGTWVVLLLYLIEIAIFWNFLN